MFGWRNIYVTLSMFDLERVKQALEQSGIPYRWKVNETSSSPIGRANMRSHGSIGLNLDVAKQYSLYVKKEDVQQAEHIMNHSIR